METKRLKKILIVDDEPSILLSLSYALKVDGVEVITCNEIEQAEEALENSRFDLVRHSFGPQPDIVWPRSVA